MSDPANNRDTSATEAFQWGLPLPTHTRIITDRTIQQHPDLRNLDVYLNWLYADGPAPEGITEL